MVLERERRAIDARGHVDAEVLHRGVGDAQVRPARDALEHDAVLLLALERGLVLLDELLALFVELDERVERALLAACHRGDGHVVEQVEALVRCGLVVQVLGRLEPFLADAARDAADLLELLLVPLLARDLLELRDGVAELRAHVLDALAVDVVLVVEEVQPTFSPRAFALRASSYTSFATSARTRPATLFAGSN